MAVVQISRIQVRRGQKNTGTGLPQLASGELAWAVDTQELFIGNGSVSEGAPYVGNSKILTTNDNILDLFEQYQYKQTDPTIRTGSDSNYPIVRTIQERLDERVSIAAFGAVGDEGSNNDTAAFQRAVNQLYLNPATIGLYQGRFTLELGPGVYTLSSTVYIPSYASIVGAGQGRTVIRYTGTGSAFEFIDDTSTVGNPVTTITSYNNQPKNVLMKGFSLSITSANVTGFKLNSVRNSLFEDIGITGIWTTSTAIQANSIGFGMYALSSVVTCELNQFNRVSVNNVSYGVFAKQDIKNNAFNKINFKSLHMGVSFGVGANLSSAGGQFGPRNNTITDCIFEDVNRQGIKIANGTNNISSFNRFANVGNDLGGVANPLYGIIEFDTSGNFSSQDIFDRAGSLASTNLTTAYIGEVIGKTTFSNAITRQLAIGQTNDFITLFRLPLANTIGYEIDYVYQSANFSRMRKGKIFIAVDKLHNGAQLVDEYEFVGADGETNLEFKAEMADSDLNSTLDTIKVSYKNTSVADNGTFIYSYKAVS